MELNNSVVVVLGFAGMIFGFIGVIGTMVGIAIWLDRKHSARMDRFEKQLDGMLEDLREIHRNMQALISKVDRAQGSLDVLVFGERGVPEPVAQERAAMSSRAEESVGG